jgi:hypothetical protein
MLALLVMPSGLAADAMILLTYHVVYSLTYIFNVNAGLAAVPHLRKPAHPVMLVLLPRPGLKRLLQVTHADVTRASTYRG